MSPLRPTIKADRGGIAAAGDVHIGLDEAAMTAEIARLADNEAERRALQDEVNRLRNESHILDRAIITLLQDVGERIGDSTQYPVQLRRAGERYQQLLAEAERPRNLPAEFEAVRQEAAALIREGRLDEADARLASLRQEMASWRAEQHAMLQRASLNESIVLAERARIAKTRLRYRDAAALLAEAADLTAFDHETSWRLRLAQANVLQAFGCEFGDNVALCEAIAAYDQALALAPRKSRPADWATTQVNLGNALATIGSRSTETEPLKRAIEAYEAALLEYNRDSVPLDWAGIQSNLGKARRTLGSRESSTTNLQRAVEAYESALLEYTRERVPNYWAVTHENLAVTRLEIGRRRGDADEVRAALVDIEATLEVYRAEDDAFYIWRAERMREQIVTALGNLGD